MRCASHHIQLTISYQLHHQQHQQHQHHPTRRLRVHLRILQLWFVLFFPPLFFSHNFSFLKWSTTPLTRVVPLHSIARLKRHAPVTAANQSSPSRFLVNQWFRCFFRWCWWLIVYIQWCGAKTLNDVIDVILFGHSGVALTLIPLGSFARLLLF